MATRMRVVGIVDIVRVDDAAEMNELNDHPAIGRAPTPGGGLINRMLRRRIETQLRTAGGQLLPVFVDRDDASGRERRLALTDALEKRDVREALQTTALARLGRYVAGSGTASEAAVVLQQVLGRIFVPTFLASEETYAAARVFDRWPRSGPLGAVWLRISGRIRRARALLSTRAHGDPHCLHAIGVAVHNVVKAVESMRMLAASGSAPDESEADAVAARCLVAPASAIRWCRNPITFEGRRLRRGTLVQFRLAAMSASAGRHATFHTGEWSQCPAAGFVPRLLAEIWRESRRIH